MLVFTRRRDEAIMIGDGITVRVIRVGRNGVRLGVEAPPSVPVHRREIYEQIVAANVSAAGAPSQLSTIVDRLRKAQLVPSIGTAPTTTRPTAPPTAGA